MILLSPTFLLLPGPLVLTDKLLPKQYTCLPQTITLIVATGIGSQFSPVRLQDLQT